MAHGIDRRRCLVIVIMARHASIGMFMTLHHQVNPILLNQVIEHPSLNQVVMAFQREKRMMQNHNLPTCAAVLQLTFQPTALGQQVRQFTVTVQQEELCRTITDGIDLVVLNLGIKEIGINQGKTAFQRYDDALQIVVITCHGEQGHRLTDAVHITEGLCPALIFRTIRQVASTNQELGLGMISQGFLQNTVGSSAHRILHITYIHERQVVTVFLVGLEMIPLRGFPVGHSTIGILGIRAQLTETGHIIGGHATA